MLAFTIEASHAALPPHDAQGTGYVCPILDTPLVKRNAELRPHVMGSDQI